MLSKRSANFRFVDRNRKDSLVLIPGWATDSRIFSELDLPFNYILVASLIPERFDKDLSEFLKNYNITKISIFGFSLGGFVAAAFAESHKETVRELLLISVRKKYEEDEIRNVRERLKKNKKAFLYKFYKDCFPAWESVLPNIKNLLKSYCEEIELDLLMNTLRYLETAKIDFENLKNIQNVTVVYGSRDTIAPIFFRAPATEKVSRIRFIRLEGAGHMPFLEKGMDVTEWFRKT